MEAIESIHLAPHHVKSNLLILRASTPPVCRVPRPCVDCAFWMFAAPDPLTREHTSTGKFNGPVDDGQQRTRPCRRTIPGKCAPAHGNVHAVYTEREFRPERKFITIQVDRRCWYMYAYRIVRSGLRPVCSLVSRSSRPSRTLYIPPSAATITQLVLWEDTT